ncbi:MAG: ribonuclease H-like domain-containing protein [Deltaproteobacteria bacterium]|nr:ribonuclease H-like domain-containing protein [Deltaproteobacteria bacterium]
MDELRRRLDRLLGPGKVVSGDRVEPPRRPPRPAPVPLAELVGGRRISTPSGLAFAAEALYPHDTFHGRLPVGELGTLPGAGAQALFPEAFGGVSRSEEIAFVDTETTGLDGGAGTVPFLVGVARWTEGGFRVVQLFLEDLDGEAHLLEAFAGELAGVRCLVTYNGGPFDLPILQNRHVLQRLPSPMAGAAHLDLLPPARTLWRFRNADCRLATLEGTVLEFQRSGDVPSCEIPGIYRQYLANGPDEDLAAVFVHNRWDLLSLAGLLWAAGRAADGHPEGTGPGVGLIHARKGRRREARCALEESLSEDLPRELRLRALREVSLACKEAREWERALEVWAEMRALAPGDSFPVEEAAKALEHRLRNDAGALALIEEALARGPWPAVDRGALERRRARLRRKLSAASSAS